MLATQLISSPPWPFLGDLSKLVNELSSLPRSLLFPFRLPRIFQSTVVLPALPPSSISYLHLSSLPQSLDAYRIGHSSWQVLHLLVFSPAHRTRIHLVSFPRSPDHHQIHLCLRQLEGNLHLHQLEASQKLAGVHSTKLMELWMWQLVERLHPTFLWQA